MSEKKRSARGRKRNSENLHLDPASVRVWRQGKTVNSSPPIADLDDLRFGFFDGHLYFVADVSKRGAARRTEISVSFTPAALAQLAAIAVCKDEDNEFPMPV